MREEQLNWRRNWLLTIFKFAHLEFQENVWVKSKYPNVVGTFTEDVCQYFDDVSLDDNYQFFVTDGSITQEEINSICDFHIALDTYVANTNDPQNVKAKYTNEEILKDPDWHEVVKLGNDSWSKLKKIIKDPSEIEYMNNLESEYLS
jgi:hypothetical protein